MGSNSVWWLEKNYFTSLSIHRLANSVKIKLTQGLDRILFILAREVLYEFEAIHLIIRISYKALNLSSQWTKRLMTKKRTMCGISRHKLRDKTMKSISQSVGSMPFTTCLHLYNGRPRRTSLLPQYYCNSFFSFESFSMKVEITRNKSYKNSVIKCCRWKMKYYKINKQRNKGRSYRDGSLPLQRPRLESFLFPKSTLTFVSPEQFPYAGNPQASISSMNGKKFRTEKKFTVGYYSHENPGLTKHDRARTHVCSRCLWYRVGDLYYTCVTSLPTRSSLWRSTNGYGIPCPIC